MARLQDKITGLIAQIDAREIESVPISQVIGQFEDVRAYFNEGRFELSDLTRTHFKYPTFVGLTPGRTLTKNDLETILDWAIDLAPKKNGQSPPTGVSDNLLLDKLEKALQKLKNSGQAYFNTEEMLGKYDDAVVEKFFDHYVISCAGLLAGQRYQVEITDMPVSKLEGLVSSMKLAYQGAEKSKERATGVSGNRLEDKLDALMRGMDARSMISTETLIGTYDDARIRDKSGVLYFTPFPLYGNSKEVPLMPQGSGYGMASITTLQGILSGIRSHPAYLRARKKEGAKAPANGLPREIIERVAALKHIPNRGHDSLGEFPEDQRGQILQALTGSSLAIGFYPHFIACGDNEDAIKPAEDWLATVGKFEGRHYKFFEFPDLNIDLTNSPTRLTAIVWIYLTLLDYLQPKAISAAKSLLISTYTQQELARAQDYIDTHKELDATLENDHAEIWLKDHPEFRRSLSYSPMQDKLADKVIGSVDGFLFRSKRYLRLLDEVRDKYGLEIQAVEGGMEVVHDFDLNQGIPPLGKLTFTRKADPEDQLLAWIPQLVTGIEKLQSNWVARLTQLIEEKGFSRDVSYEAKDILALTSPAGEVIPPAPLIGTEHIIGKAAQAVIQAAEKMKLPDVPPPPVPEGPAAKFTERKSELVVDTSALLHLDSFRERSHQYTWLDLLQVAQLADSTMERIALSLTGKSAMPCPAIRKTA